MDYDFSNNSYNIQNYDTHSPEPSNGFALAALICGIVAIALGCCFYVSVPCGGLAITFALFSKGGTMNMTSKAKIGLLLGIIGMVLSVVVFFLLMVFAAASSFYY